MKFLLDAKIRTERALSALGEELGWTYKYAWQLREGDEIITSNIEGVILKVTPGPAGIVVHFGEKHHKYLPPEDLVSVLVPQTPEPF